MASGGPVAERAVGGLRQWCPCQTFPVISCDIIEGRGGVRVTNAAIPGPRGFLDGKFKEITESQVQASSSLGEHAKRELLEVQKDMNQGSWRLPRPYASSE